MPRKFEVISEIHDIENIAVGVECVNATDSIEPMPVVGLHGGAS